MKTNSSAAKYLSLMFFILSSCNKDIVSSCSKSIDPNNITCSSTNLNTNYSGFKQNFNSDSTIIISEGNYEQGKQQGFWKYNYPNGKPFKEGNFTFNKINGHWKLFYESGNLREEGSYSNCLRIGYWKFFFDNKEGGILSEGNFNNGIKTGHWIFYNEKGEIIEEKDC